MNKRIDLLNREEFVENVIKVVNQLSELEKGCCFAIEGSWGIGKTFVIEKIEKRLKLIQLKKTNSDRYFVFHYNCWQHDYYEEPAVAIISAMLASIKQDEVMINEEVEGVIKAGYESVGAELKKIAGLYIENKIGINLISWADKIKDKKDKTENSEQKFDKLFNFSQTIEKVREKLQKIAKERTAVLFVDELDRCIPQYAIKVLERLHHSFYGLENIVVVLAIDRKQLEHSVEEMFGARKDELSIDVEKYLKKFIDFSMVLDNGRMDVSYWKKYGFYFNKFKVKSSYDVIAINNILPRLFKGTDIRRVEKIIEKASMVHSLVCNEKMDSSVLIFEVMYEVLRLWEFGDLQYVAVINERYDEIEKKMDEEKIEFLKLFANEAYEYAYNFSEYDDTIGETEDCINVQNNLYGKVFWYFADIFYDNQVPYVDSEGYMDSVKDELEVARKYCEFCEIVK